MYAVLVWALFILSAILLNGAIPFALGRDLHAWTYSTFKAIAFHLIIYAGLFLVVPLILLKGWGTVSRPAFLLPLIIAVAAITLSAVVRPAAAIVVIVLAYLHKRVDLSDFGIRSNGWKKDAVAVILIIVIGAAPALFRQSASSATVSEALLAGVKRLFANPASTVENLFYFGFLAERVSHSRAKRFTPLIIAFMYVTHEMTNPEYWYEHVSFIMIFFGIAIYTAIYMWRRSVIVIWLGDGLSRIARLII
jgi:hypothetical protein